MREDSLGDRNGTGQAIHRRRTLHQPNRRDARILRRAHPLAPRIAGGYRMLSISDPRTPMPLAMQDPDGNEIELVPAGQRGVDQIEIHIGVTDEAAFEKFYGDAISGERLG